MPASESNLDSIPTDQQGSFSSFLKTLASFTGDLSSLTCPSFLLAPISLLEYSSFWADQPELLAAISKSDKEEERFYAAVRWFISSLNGSFSSRVPKGEWEKKPFNPILGEQFLCAWENGTRITCEQVSHHPPVSGFYIENKEAGVTVNGHDGQKTRFSGTQMLVDQVGYCVVSLTHRDEKYLFTLPSLSVNGIWYAAPYVELYGTSYVQSSSGFFASIEYTTKGWISGELHHFKATVTHDSLAGPTIIEGQWTAKSSITKHKQNSEPFLDLASLAKTEPKVKPISEQDELESRRVWEKVSEALKASDYATASAEKSVIENQQRALRKERQINNESWEPKHFKAISGEELYGNLRNQILAKSDSKFVDTMGDSGWLHRGL
ncbi:Oxysterol binding protein [Apophysomyces sp. BC1034]|nr:Oxysterol binding protein [Apophysomyces sp. BC1015]KAG0179107.1 Oxysterol binding protein [Apophysomyces sp. BC1021]KAG0184595.1 Oxysterol binding protein [Apophysomyces sp. BC1034]